MAGLVPATHEHPAPPVFMDRRDQPADDGKWGKFVRFVRFWFVFHPGRPNAR
jgi:hypothetical protein